MFDISLAQAMLAGTPITLAIATGVYQRSQGIKATRAAELAQIHTALAGKLGRDEHRIICEDDNARIQGKLDAVLEKIVAAKDEREKIAELVAAREDEAKADRDSMSNHLQTLYSQLASMNATVQAATKNAEITATAVNLLAALANR